MNDVNGTRIGSRLTIAAFLISLTALLLHILTINSTFGLDELAIRLNKTEDKCTSLRNEVERNRQETFALLRLIQESTDLQELKRKTRDSFPKVREQPEEDTTENRQIPDMESKNAADFYRAAFNALPPKTELSAEQQEVLDSFQTAPIDKTSARLVQLLAPALRLLRRGAALQCDWGIKDELRTKGVTIDSFPHHSQSRSLFFAAGVEMRFAFNGGKPREALDDMFAVLTLARHVGADGTMVGKLTGIAIEMDTIRFVATLLTEVKDPAFLRALLKRLDDLPPPVTIAEVIKSEKEWQLAWLRRGGAKKLTRGGNEISLDDLAKLFDQAAAIAELPREQMETAAAALQEKAKAKPGVFAMLVPDPANYCRSEYIAITLRALFRAAIVVSVDGVDQLKHFKDPFGTGPFVFRKLDDGFQLESQLKLANGRAVSVTVGTPPSDNNP